MEHGFIWLADEAEKTETAETELVYFRGRLTLDDVPESFPVRVAAETRYKLWVNGVFLGAGPAKGNREERYFDTVDLSAALRAGDNVVAVAVLRYPPGRSGNQSVLRSGTPGLAVVSVAAGEDGVPAFSTGPDWRAHRDSSIRFAAENPWYAPLQFYEEASGDAALLNWREPLYDDSGWNHAVPAAGRELSPRPVPLLRQEIGGFRGISKCSCDAARSAWDAFREGHPLCVPAGSCVWADFDAGALSTGYLHLAVAGGAGAKVTLLQSECYVESLPEKAGYRVLPRKGDRSDASGELVGYVDRYTVCGGGTDALPEVYEPYWFRTFRYVRLTVETSGEPLTLLGFDYTETEYPLEVRTHVTTSDPGMDGIWDISLRSLRLCMHETYEDCPFYEQLQYTMDARSEMLYTYAVSGDDRLARRCMEDFRASARPDGMLDARAPSVDPNVIPGFSIYYIGMLRDHMMYFGDRALLERHMPTVRGILNYFHTRRDSRGLVDRLGSYNGAGPVWSFIDWTPRWRTGVPPAVDHGPLTMESLLYLLGLEYAAELCGYLELEEERADLENRAEELRGAVRKFCLGADGLLRDGPEVEDISQHGQVFGALTGTLTRTQGRAVLERTLKEPEKYPQCSVAMAFYLFRALERCELYEYTGELWSAWRRMVEDHMTTCAESAGNPRSDCHAWGALALWELPSAVLGVRPAEPGCGRLLVKPLPGIFTSAEGEVITPRGVVKVSWRMVNGRLELDASGPQGVELEMEPGGSSLAGQTCDVRGNTK